MIVKNIYNALFLLLFFLMSCYFAVAEDSDTFHENTDSLKSSSQSIADEINAIWQKQAASWNNGDIEAYMNAYVKSDKLRFASENSVKYGWQQTLQAYKKRYHNRDLMGKLTFTEIETSIFSDRYAMIFGRYRLSRIIDGRKSDMEGLVSTVFRRQANGQWLIVYDHTSD